MHVECYCIIYVGYIALHGNDDAASLESAMASLLDFLIAKVGRSVPVNPLVFTGRVPRFLEGHLPTSGFRSGSVISRFGMKLTGKMLVTKYVKLLHSLTLEFALALNFLTPSMRRTRPHAIVGFDDGWDY